MHLLPSPLASQSVTAGKPSLNRGDQAELPRLRGEGFITADGGDLTSFKAFFDAASDEKSILRVSKRTLSSAAVPNDQPKDIALAESADDDSDGLESIPIAERVTAVDKQQKQPIVGRENAVPVEDLLLEETQLRIPEIGDSFQAQNRVDANVMGLLHTDQLPENTHRLTGRSPEVLLPADQPKATINAVPLSIKQSVELPNSDTPRLKNRTTRAIDAPPHFGWPIPSKSVANNGQTTASMLQVIPQLGAKENQAVQTRGATSKEGMTNVTSAVQRNSAGHAALPQDTQLSNQTKAPAEIGQPFDSKQSSFQALELDPKQIAPTARVSALDARVNQTTPSGQKSDPMRHAVLPVDLGSNHTHQAIEVKPTTREVPAHISPAPLRSKPEPPARQPTYPTPPDPQLSAIASPAPTASVATVSHISGSTRNNHFPAAENAVAKDRPSEEQIPLVSNTPRPSKPTQTVAPLQPGSDKAFDLISSTKEHFTIKSDEIAATQSTHTSVSPQRPEMPLHIARQLAEVAQHLPSRPVEITLRPEELGRVRLSVTPSEHGIVVNVLAERPETLDLMRRHIGDLAQEFQVLGYEDITFSFSDADQHQPDEGTTRSSENHPDHAARDHDDGVGQSTQIHLATGAATGLDLRL